MQGTLYSHRDIFRTGHVGVPCYVLCTSQSCFQTVTRRGKVKAVYGRSLGLRWAGAHAHSKQVPLGRSRESAAWLFLGRLCPEPGCSEQQGRAAGRARLQSRAARRPPAWGRPRASQGACSAPSACEANCHPYGAIFSQDQASLVLGKFVFFSIGRGKTHTPFIRKPLAKGRILLSI